MPHPLPRLRSHVQLTYPGGFNAVCPEHGGRQWVRDVVDARTICNVDGCIRSLAVQACPPEEITGIVREVGTSVLGNAIVRVGTSGTRDSQWLNWDIVETAEVRS